MIYFILGIVFLEIIIPTLEAISSIIIAKTEVIKMKASVKIAKYQAEIDNDEKEIRVIGFSSPNPEEEEDE